MKTLTQNQITSICNRLFDRLPTLLKTFQIEYIEYPNRYSFSCPIHGGDNPEGCSIFTDGTSSKGNWRCWTRQCENDFTSTLLGFVRGVLVYNRGQGVSLNQTADFCLKFLDVDIDNLEVSEQPQNKDVQLLEIFDKHLDRYVNDIKREDIRSKIDIPAPYYINRGFCTDILNLFDIGVCLEKNRPMSGRIVVPIYDESYNYVGCMGRAIHTDMQPKWLHSKGFKKAFLYGLNIAKDYIQKSQTVILVEGQGDVWRMHEAGYQNCVGIFGSSINDDQLLLLEQSGALNLVILTDFDEAGKKASKQIIKKCGRRFNYYRPALSTKDVGDMDIDTIHQELKPQLQEVNLI